MSIAVLKTIFPFQIVASQLKIFTPVGTATSIVVKANTEFISGLPIEVNMWCAHTR